MAHLDPSLTILLVERLDQVALESSDGWNNAGTGHAGYCELNYTPQTGDGSVTIQRALAINAAFEISLQFWSALVEQTRCRLRAPSSSPLRIRTWSGARPTSAFCASGTSS